MANTQVLLARRPTGWPTEANFSVVETQIPEPQDGEFLVRVLWLSLDPYMRGRMNDGKSYAAKVELGDVMVGGGVGEIVASKKAGVMEWSFSIRPSSPVRARRSPKRCAATGDCKHLACDSSNLTGSL